MARHAIQAQERSAAMRRTAAPRRSANPSDALALDPVIHERVRLGIISALAVNDVLSFGDLKKLLETTDGNLSVHARKLEDSQTPCPVKNCLRAVDATRASPPTPRRLRARAR